MMAQRKWVMVGFAALLLVTVGQVQAQSWKPAFGDADELYDAAEDLHDRAERLKDARVMPLTAQLETMTTELYQLLKKNACPSDVVTMLNATGATLQEVDMLVTLSCQMSKDRKSMSELGNLRRYYDLTARHIFNALGQPNSRVKINLQPVEQPLPPTWYQAPAYGVEVQYQQPGPRPLPRVRIAQF